MSHFNEPNMERKICVTKYERLSEMCIVPHVETKSVVQPIKQLVSTTVKSAKLATMF